MKFITIAITLVLCAFFSVEGQVGNQDKEAISAPYFENFDNVVSPEIPVGWNKIVENSTTTLANVHTVTYGPPISAPNNIRLFSNGNPDANVMLITPALANLTQNRIRFQARSSHATERPHFVVGTMSNPADATTFTAFHTIAAVDFSNVYTEYIVNFNGYTGTDTHIAFKFDGSSGLSSNRAVYLDDFHYEAMPAAPVFTIEPQLWHFGEVDVVEVSAPKSFEIKNGGLGSLHIESVVLNNTDDFILDGSGNFPVVISGSQTATFAVSASPGTAGPLTGQVTISWHDGSNKEMNTFVVELTVNGTARPAGSTCGNPFYIESFPFTHEGTTQDKGSDYSTAWVTPSTAYLSGNDMVFSFTIDQTSYFSGSITTPQVWTGLVIVDQCPDELNPPQRTFVAGTGSGSTVEFEDVILHPGTYFGIIGSFKPPQFVDFTLNLQAVPVPPGPEFAISPAETEFDFGVAGAGVLPEFRNYTLSNTGGGVLEIVSIEISGSQDFSLDLDNFDFSGGFHSIGLEQEFVFSVLFGPETLGAKTAQLTITYNDDLGSHTHLIGFTGEGVNVNVDVLPWSESFEEERFPPLGWSYVNGEAGAFWDRVNWHSISGENSARAYQGSTSANKANEWLISPPINLAQVQGAKLSFFGMSHKEHQNSTIADIHVYITNQLYDNPEDLQQHGVLLSVERLSTSWQEYVLDLDDYSGQYYIALNYKVNIQSPDFNWIFVDDIKVFVPQQVTFVVNDTETNNPIEGAYVLLSADDNSYTGITGADGEVNFTVDAFITYDFTVRAGGYLPETGQITVENEHVIVDAELSDRVSQPVNLNVSTSNLQQGQALLKWDHTQESGFRFDDGNVAGQLGSSGATLNTVIGMAFRNDAEISQVSWYLTDEGGDHPTVKVWVFGLDANGMPDTDNIIFSQAGVPNINNQWNAFAFPEPLNAPNGFLIGFSHIGFLGIATDTGTDTDWPFQPNTSFFAGDISTDVFTPIENLGDFSGNLLIRAKGYDFEQLVFDTPEKTLSFSTSDIELSFVKAESHVSAGAPDYATVKTDKAFLGYDIFLDDLNEPVATGVMVREFLFEQLLSGDYTAGVRAVFSGQTTEVSSIDFTVVDGVPASYMLYLVSEPQEGGTISGAGEYIQGESVEITAEPADGYAFMHWTDEQQNIVSELEVYQFFMPANELTLTALFQPNTGLNETSSEGISVYPNPATGFININSPKAISTIQIINIHGAIVRIIKVGEENIFRLDLHDLNSGIYFLQIFTDNGIFVEKIQLRKE